MLEVTDKNVCLKYRGVRSKLGYGRVNFGEQRYYPNGASRGRFQVLLHRHIMERVIGRKLRSDEVVMHQCDEPSCIRVSHLRVGTQGDNVRDMDMKGRRRPRGLRGSASPNAKLGEDDVRAILVLRGTAPSRVVGAQFGVSAANIRDIWCRTSWRHVEADDVATVPSYVHHGEASGGAATLTQAQVDEMRLLHASGTRNQQQLGAMFGIHPATVSKIVRGKSWSRSWRPE